MYSIDPFARCKHWLSFFNLIYIIFNLTYIINILKYIYLKLLLVVFS